MKTILVAIDSKYIHTNLAIRYLKANTTYETHLMEFTIKDRVSFIVDKIIESNPEIIGFSSYIWNIEIIKVVTKTLKEKSNSIIIWGGPEVSFDEEYFLENNPVDFIIRGEGEIAFHKLLDALHKSLPFQQIAGLAYKDSGIVHSNPINEILDLNTISTAVNESMDSRGVSSKVNYVETSRGCPFHCSYCLASLENSVRFFDLERVKTELILLMGLGGKTFKFLDRTFNANSKYAISVFDFLISNSKKGMSFQFEITGDILKPKIIDHINKYAPPHLFRFEIGVQSTNVETNKAVNRIQNNKLLFENIQKIKDGNIIDMHLDLIAGLPYEDLTSFKNTFDEVFSLYAKELQLGFLKMLRGTSIRLHAHKFGYVYHELPPYEIIQNDSLSKTDILEIHQVEEMLEIFWNKGFMNQTVEFITRKVFSPFEFFLQLAIFMDGEGFLPHRYQLHELFLRFHHFIQVYFSEDEKQIFSMLKKEYLLYHKIKPKIWWEKEFENKNEILREIHETHPEYRLDDYYKYGVVTRYEDHILLVLYFPNKKTVTIEYGKEKKLN